MATVYFCKDSNGVSYDGKTLVEAWRNYENDCGDDRMEHLKFYRAEEVEIEVVEKPVIIKTPAAKKPTSKK